MRGMNNMNKGQELVEAPKAGLQLFEAFIDPLEELKELSLTTKFDIETYEGETDCKKFIAKIGKFRIGVEKLRVSLKADFLEKGRTVDKEAKVYQASIAEIDAIYSVPLKKLEAKRIAEVLDAREKEQAELKAIEDKREAELKEREAKVVASEAKIKEAEDAALVVRQAAEHKEELEATALLAAEEATRKAKQDTTDAIALAVATENRRVADLYATQQAEQDAIEEADRKRQANVEHRKKFNNIAVNALDNLTHETEISIEIVKAIVKGEIANVTMNY
jgi:hypothetical protein